MDDLSLYLQKGINSASSGHTCLVIPRGTYILRPKILFEHESKDVTLCCALLRSHLSIIGERGAVLRVVGGVTTPEVPVSFSVLATDQPLRRVSIIGITIDLNGELNQSNFKDSINQPNRFNQSAICVSGTPKGIAARIDHCIIERVTISNCPGSCCIVAGQSNSRGAVLGKDWVIRFCTFHNNGWNTDDHSSIFAWVNGAVIENNLFYSEILPYNISNYGPNTAYEVHGSNHIFRGNVVTNYYRGVWVASNYTSTVHGTRIYDNRFLTVFYGVSFFQDRPSLFDINDTEIYSNIFQFDDSTLVTRPSPGIKVAVLISAPYAQHFVKVTINNATKYGDNIPATFLLVSPGEIEGEEHGNISCHNNEATGFTFGAYLRTTKTNGLGNIDLTNNNWLQLKSAGSYRVPYAEVALITGVLQSIQNLKVGGGQTTFADVSQQRDHDTRRIETSVNKLWVISQ